MGTDCYKTVKATCSNLSGQLTQAIPNDNEGRDNIVYLLTGSQRLIGTKMNPTIGHTSSSKECDYMSSIAKNIDCSPLISD